MRERQHRDEVERARQNALRADELQREFLAAVESSLDVQEFLAQFGPPEERVDRLSPVPTNPKNSLRA